MKIHNCYFQDKVYKEMISLHDVFLMLGRKHELVLETSPEVGVSDWQGISDAPLSFTIEGKKFHIDLTKETKEREVKIVLSSKENDFSEWFLLHLFSPIRKEDLYGTYRCLDNKRQVLVLGEKKTSLDLDDLADTSCLSKDHFSRLFKHETGISPLQYINQKKIEKAQLMLVTSNMPVKNIASSLACDNYSYFNRLFKKMTGVPPQEYRNSYH